MSSPARHVRLRLSVRACGCMLRVCVCVCFVRYESSTPLPSPSPVHTMPCRARRSSPGRSWDTLCATQRLGRLYAVSGSGRSVKGVGVMRCLKREGGISAYINKYSLLTSPTHPPSLVLSYGPCHPRGSMTRIGRTSFMGQAWRPVRVERAGRGGGAAGTGLRGVFCCFFVEFRARLASGTRSSDRAWFGLTAVWSVLGLGVEDELGSEARGRGRVCAEGYGKGKILCTAGLGYPEYANHLQTW